jgi:hypothetical protein
MVALAASSSALADTYVPTTSLAESTNFRPMPCLGAGKGYAGLISSAATVTNVSGKGVKTLTITINAGLLFTWAPFDSNAVSYLGEKAMAQSLTLPAGATSAEIPVIVPLLGSDGSISAVSTTASASFTAISTSKYAGDLTIGDFACVANALQPAVTAIPASVTTSLKQLMTAAAKIGAAGAITSEISQSGLDGFATLLAGGVSTVDAILSLPGISSYIDSYTAILNQVNAATP